ncbi:hypothetical protein QTO34_016624 [Cnephaeus nilssonii]|uniref:Uncharacterized protein n=1 Tax=Cnephaeus nilssonii TaxID=3371016 RepID=A0AA40I2K8_CNENI|nr:hypothetical protein QTO34_016624 [Eptesicus nilssonii]
MAHKASPMESSLENVEYHIDEDVGFALPNPLKQWEVEKPSEVIGTSTGQQQQVRVAAMVLAAGVAGLAPAVGVSRGSSASSGCERQLPALIAPQEQEEVEKP